jgi:hypothetical protein
MKRMRAWPTAPMIAFVCAVLGGVAAATLVSYYRSVTPVVPNAADVNRLDDQIGNNKSAAGAASTNRSETSASPRVSATDRPLITKTEQQTGNRSSAKRQAPTQPKHRNANRSRVEFKGPPVRKP